MTIAELLATARERASSNCTCPDHRFAKAVVELLEAPAPCGWPEAEAVGSRVVWEALGDQILSHEEVRWIIATLASAGAKAGA